MGKRARARLRREQVGRPDSSGQLVRGATRGPELHVTVAALPTSGDDLDLAHETELVKAAVLYADRVTLASPKALMLASLCVLCASSDRTRVEAMADIVSVVEGGQELAGEYRRLRSNRRHLSPEDRLLLSETERILRNMGEEVVDGLVTTLDASGMEELAFAMEAGVLEIHALGGDAADGESFIDVAISRMRDLLVESVSPSATALPLFDNTAGNLLEAMVREGQVADAARAPAVEVGTAGRLVGRLDAFPDARMDEILDIRTQLQKPLVRFRAALAAAAQEFGTAAWEQSFGTEVDRFYRAHVAPAILEIEETLEQLGARPTLLRLTSKEGLASGAKLGLTAAAVGGVAKLPALLFGAPGAAIAAVAASEQLERRGIRTAAEENSFYFLYDADRRLVS